MKVKIIKSIMFIAVTIMLVTLLFACSDETTDVYLSKITVENTHEGNYVLGEDVDLSEVTVTAIYSDGEKRTVVLTDDMLSEKDRDKFFKKGVHSITVTYEDKTAVFQITVAQDKETKFYHAQFFSNGGSDIEDQYTDVITEFLAPTREGYTFKGWYSTYDFSGSRAIASPDTPYELKADTNFYALWEDNRRCHVVFMDEGQEFYNFDVVYNDSIDITDLTKYPAPPEKVGKVFAGWKLTSGSTFEITTDTVITASYTSINCTVLITYWDDDAGKLVEDKPYLLKYGDQFNVAGYTMPTEEGHTSRWVVYKESDNYSAYHELEDTLITVTESIKIRAMHVINTYSVTIYNGKESQTDADLKSGAIALERIYFDPATYTDFTIEYDKDLLISNYTQEPVLKTPRAMTGYDVYWCYVTTTLSGEEIWRNTDNKVWNDTTQAFEVLDGEEATTNFELKDRDGNHIADISNGDIYHVKGNVVLKAKYVKKEYTVRLLRRIEGVWTAIKTFTNQKYRSDFTLYDPDMYPDSMGFATWREVESYYLMHNVVGWSTDNDVTNDWRSIYYNVDNSNPDDWNIEWYSASAQGDDKLVSFTEKSPGVLGSYEIRDNLDLYCKDIDLRRYQVVLKYEYDFDLGDYAVTYDCGLLGEDTPLEKPTGCEASVIRTYHAHNDSTLTYTFDGWYDYPYEPDGNGTTGERYQSLDARTRNMIYYAHYKCETVYTVTINDKTQSTAFTGTPYENHGYAVDQQIVYSVPAGTLFSLDMIYKGRDTAGGYVPGSTYYSEADFMNYVLGDGGKASPNGVLTAAYIDTIALYDPDTTTYATALDNLNARIAELQAQIDAYVLLLGKIYSYGYTGDDSFTKAYFDSTFLSHDEYNTVRRQLKDCENDKDLLTSYADNLELAKSYYDKNESYASEGGLYKKYADSYIDLNAAYGKDVTDPLVKAKYRFVGWYLDAEYTQLYQEDRDMDFTWFASGSNLGLGRSQLDLYAKWADEEKGSEGLVFRAVYDNAGDPLGVVVVDYIDKSEYEASSYYGCGFNNFDQYEYSVNYNDSGTMPVSLGNNIEIQIPASHGGSGISPLPVLGILSDAFSRTSHSFDVVSIDLPDTVAFVQEGAFKNCTSLELISGTGDDSYVNIVEQRALYQWNDYPTVKLRSLDGLSYEVIELRSKNLIVYAARDSLARESFTLETGTEIISDYAFYSASALKYVTLGNSLISIGEKAFMGSNLSGSVASDPHNLILPATLTTVKKEAFANCVGVTTITGGAGINKVGKDAFTTTGWYTDQIGVIAINGIALGVRDPEPSNFDKDGDVTRITVLNGVNKYSYTNTYGVLYYNVDGGDLTDMVINNTVTGISDSAFCASDKPETATLINATIEGTLNYGIGDSAFANCVNLRDVYAQNLSNVCVIADNAFTGCNGGLNIHR